jgi:hypothetical protein
MCLESNTVKDVIGQAMHSGKPALTESLPQADRATESGALGGQEPRIYPKSLQCNVCCSLSGLHSIRKENVLLAGKKHDRENESNDQPTQNVLEVMSMLRDSHSTDVKCVSEWQNFQEKHCELVRFNRVLKKQGEIHRTCRGGDCVP